MIQPVQRGRTLIITIVMSAMMAAFFSSLAVARTAPSMFDVLFGALPFFALGACLVMAACHMLRIDIDVAQEGTVRILLAAAAISVVASFIGAWDNIGAILLPQQALYSMLTLGFWPFGEGPIAIIRFMPLVLAGGTFILARRASVSEGRAACAAIVVYFAQVAATYSLSWIVWADVVRGPGDILENTQDAFRIFVTSNVNGYWTNSQAERFLASTGEQAETGMQALQGASAFAFALMVTAGTWIPWKRYADTWRDLFDLGLLRQAGLIFFGAIIGYSVRMGGAPFADAVAYVLFLGAAVTWLAAWKSEADDGHMSGYYLAIAIISSCLLGWPVAAGFVAADLVRRLIVRDRTWPGTVAAVVGAALTGFALAWAGLAFGLRDLPVAVWMLRPVGAVAFLAAGSGLGMKLLRSALAPQWQAAYILGIAVVSVLISAQISFGILLLPLAGAGWWLLRQEARWDIWKVRLLDLFLAGLVLLCLLFPGLLSR